MNLTLNRRPSSGASTLGDLYIDGEWQCFTLEDTVREEADVPVEVWKVYGHTAIPAGRYQITLTHSGRFNRVLPLINDVPGFSGIRIHPGNTDADTDGCILTGKTISNHHDAIGMSRVAFDALFDRLCAAEAIGDEIWIDVVNP